MGWLIRVSNKLKEELLKDKKIINGKFETFEEVIWRWRKKNNKGVFLE